MNTIIYIFSKYLRLQRYHLAEHEVRSRLLSDPGNSVVSMSNTLDYFDIQNIVATVPKTALVDLPKYFIGQLSNGEKFALALIQQGEKGEELNIEVDEKKLFSLSQEEFLKEWTGFIIAIEKDENPWFRKNLEKTLIISILSLCSVSAFVYVFWATGVFLTATYLLLAITGLLISYLTFKEKIDDNLEGSRFCKLSTNSDCNTVLKSKEAKLFNLLDLSDISIVYFSFLTLAFIYEHNNSIFFLMSACSLPMIFYSLYTQYFQLKKWCPLCLGISLVLILQFLVMVNINQGFDFDYYTILPFTFLFGIIIIGWVKLKSLLLTQQEHHALTVENLSFRRNHDLFLPYYNTLEEVDHLLDSIPKIKMGADHPLVTLTAVTNPLCKTCIQAHQVYMALLEKHPRELRIDFLFLVPNQNINEPKTQIAERLIQLYMEDSQQIFRQAFDGWYKTIDANQWLNQWGVCTDIPYNHMLRQQVTWCLQNKIDSTPAMLLNGKLFPGAYRPSDIENFIEHIINFERESSKTKEKNIMHDKTEALNVYK